MPASPLALQVKGALLQKALPIVTAPSSSLEGYLLQELPQGVRVSWTSRGPRAPRHHLLVAAGVLRFMGFSLQVEEGFLVVTAAPSTAPR